MKHIANKNYKDKELGRSVKAEEVLEEIYVEAGIELTEERIKLLVDERKLYRSETLEETEEEVDTEEVEAEVAEEKGNKNKSVKGNKKNTTKK